MPDEPAPPPRRRRTDLPRYVSWEKKRARYRVRVSVVTLLGTIRRVSGGVFRSVDAAAWAVRCKLRELREQ